MLQQQKPSDYVIGTGESHTIKEFVEEAFAYVDRKWQDYVEIDPKYFRPTEVDSLRADPHKAAEELGWKPNVRFHELVKIMVDHDMLRLGLEPPGEGLEILKKKGFSWTNHDLTTG